MFRPRHAGRFSLPARLSPFILIGVLLAGLPSQGVAQEEEPAGPAPGTALRVYLDCATFRCDQDRFRREITFVQWVRQPQDSDVHVIMTSQDAGGGNQFIFDFEGRGELEAFSDRMTHGASDTDVEEEVMEALTHTLRLGLVRFVGLAGYADAVEIVAVEGMESGDVQGESGQPVEDPWNYWVFSASLNAQVEKEDREETQEYRVNLSANRTTEDWKIDLGLFGEYSHERFEFEEDDEIVEDVFETDDWSADAVVVRSITPHWSAGGSVNAGSSTRFNQKLSVEVMPALEWNYYPWQDASRRRFVVFYGAGIEHLQYDEMTIFEVTEQTLWRHRLDISYRQQESWGNASLGVEGNQILDDLDKYSFEFQGDLSYRILRGLSVELGGSYEIIRDQIYLSAEGLDPSDILRERLQQETGSRLSFELGIRYSFGSILNSIVNSRFLSLNRFGGGGGGR